MPHTCQVGDRVRSVRGLSQNRGDDLNSIRRVAHRHGVVCLTLAKWETVSGQFGGYLTSNGEEHEKNSDDHPNIGAEQLRDETTLRSGWGREKASPFRPEGGAELYLSYSGLLAEGSPVPSAPKTTRGAGLGP